MLFGGPIFKHFEKEDEPFQERMRVAFFKLISLMLHLYDDKYNNFKNAPLMKKVGELKTQYLFEMIQTEERFWTLVLYMRTINRNLDKLEYIVDAFGIKELTAEEVAGDEMETWGLIVGRDLGMRLQCTTCGKETEQVCNGCGCTLYCSRACQKKDWKEHKQTCKQK